MMTSPALILLLLATFLLAGLVKGVIGLGLPTVAMGLLGLAMPPAEAAALLIVPSLVTNVWQLAIGGRVAPLIHRLWPLLAGICLGTWAGSAFIGGLESRWAGLGLGLALIAYAALGLAAVTPRLPARSETCSARWSVWRRAPSPPPPACSSFPPSPICRRWGWSATT